ncbi:sensor histidine kinase [Rugosimonospora africana]|uniref:histidine kinase n=1 Tax=Rugosimonospora africana TaxID=556532 RepID=A0A8J3QRZ8_9ACTN|nr:histidine kinase [Rugosimonospora africana]GIH15436.1 two-component sensor histidine kinase [Rugosimonospora africana]
METPKTLSTVRLAAPLLTNSGVGVGVAVLSLAGSLIGVGPQWISSPRPIDAVAVGLVVVVAGAVALRRRYPVSVLVVLNVVALAWSAFHYPGRLVLLIPLIACYTLAALRGWRWGLAGAGVTAFTAVVAIRVAFGAAEPSGIAGVAVWMAATAGAAGAAVGYNRAVLVATRAQLAREAQTREEQARRRVVEERLRIARELHDVLGHTMASISVQAGVGIHLLASRPAQAGEALSTIKHISDQGLTDVKAILGVLRADGDEPDRPRTPPGGLDQLDALLDSVRAAGVQPRLTIHGRARPLPAAVDLAAYRILQEALTNVVRHARASTVQLDLHYEPAHVVIRSRDDGSAVGPGQAGANGQGGHGISGMRERAMALSGQFTAGPHPDGGFQVRCTLPTPDQA